MTHPDVLDALRHFLALGGPEDGEALHAAYASTAQVYYDGTVHPIAELDAGAFASTWRFVSGLQGRPRRPEFTELALHGVDEEGPDHVVAWFTATERTDGQAVYLAGGFVREDDAWKIDWLYLDKAPQPLTMATGRMQQLADFAFGIGAGHIFPSSWLEIGYYRHHALPRPKLLVLPDARFGCQSSAGCCTVNFRIEVPDAAQAAVDAIPWETIKPELKGTQLEPMENGDRLLKAHGEVCRFLDENNRCLVHKAVGRAIFPVCAQYPFMLTPTPDGLAVASSFACSTVRQNFGPTLEERADDLYERAAMAPSTMPTSFRLAEGVEVDWDEYVEAEETIMELLDRDDLPLHRRLWVIGRLLVAWCTNEPTSIGAIEGEAIPTAEGPMRAFQGQMIRYFCTEFEDAAFKGSYELSHGQPLEPEEQLVGILRNLFHSRKCSFYMSLTASFNLAVAGYVLALQAQAAYPDKPLSGQTLRELAIMILHGKFLALTARLTEQGINPRELLGDPTFGLGLLSYPLPAQEKVEA